MLVDASDAGRLRRWLAKDPKKALAEVDLLTFQERRLLSVAARLR